MFLERYIKYVISFFIILTIFFQKNGFALEQNAEFWLGMNSQYRLTNDEKWLAYVYSQSRFINQADPWHLILLEGAMGYHFPNKASFWLGYRWSGRNPFNDFSQENRLIQQIFMPVPSRFKAVITRTRLEEIQRTDQNQISFRLRERISVEFNRTIFFDKMFPVVYDEVFFQLNKTNYTSNDFISQNRIFLGFNLRHTANAWWEIGYINQYQLNTPQNNQNQMNHILSVTYNFT